MRYFKWLGGLALMMLMMARPQAAVQGAAEAMGQWYESVAPSLFPFLALMPLLTSREVSRAYEHLLGRVMGTLFGLPGAAATAMVTGMVSGAPAGAIASRNIASQSGMDQGQLNRMALAFSGFSPAFLVGGIGVGLLGSAAMGWKLLQSQLLTQVTLAAALKWAWKDRNQPVPGMREELRGQSVSTAALTLLTICGYMMLFGALTRVIGEWVGQGPANVALCLLDVPSGAKLVAGMPVLDSFKLPLLSAMCGFGGICVIAQSLEALKGCGVRVAEFMAVRAVAGGISAGYMVLLLRFSGDRLRMASLFHGKAFELATLAAVGLVIPVLIGKKLFLNRIKNPKT